MTIAKKLWLAAAVAAAATGARAESFGLRPYLAVYADEAGAALKDPEGVACTDDRLVVADAGNARLVTFQLKDGAAVAGKELKLPQLAYPTRLQLDAAGVLYVLDGRKHEIAKVDPAGKFLEYVKFKGDSAYAFPRAFKVDAGGNVYVLDLTGKTSVLDPAGAVTRTLPRPPAPDNAMFTDVAVDGAGRIYVVDAVSATIWVAEKGAAALKPLGKSLKDNLNFPTYMTVLGQRLLVVDQNGHGLAAVGLDGSFFARTLGMGWSEGLVYYPVQICSNARNETFVADRNNNRVQMFLPAQ
ncbi:MAG TPA: NHL repeat-containing protein [Anaeromyxobacter sp.]